MRENLVVDNLLGQAVDHQRKIVEQAYSNGTVWVGKEPDNKWDHPGLKVLAGKLTRDLEDGAQGFRAATAELNRLHKLR